MLKQPLNGWLEEAKARFGDKTADWKFVCPRCGNVQTPQDFVTAGVRVEEAANIAYQQCIGRVAVDKGCNWTAYGLLGTLGNGRIVITTDGKEVDVFDFAKEEHVNA
ncbi:VVA0879 family protein [Paenibacillus residui]|uniref:VVA0879 family protein n=1 Tax=Paenibacillus residui TaxID=629724 RepID=A0ABW3DA15_9BACL